MNEYLDNYSQYFNPLSQFKIGDRMYWLFHEVLWMSVKHHFQPILGTIDYMTAMFRDIDD